MSNQERVTIEFAYVDDHDGEGKIVTCIDEEGTMHKIPRSLVYEVDEGEGGSVDFAKWKAVELGLV